MQAVSVGNGARGCSWRWDNNLVLEAGAGFELQHGGSARGGSSSWRHGDCVFNNIFACSRAGGCRPNYTHVRGWTPADLANDTDVRASGPYPPPPDQADKSLRAWQVHASNLYFPGGPLFCSAPGSGCYDLAGWRSVSGGAFGNRSLVADPAFTDARPGAWPQGLQPAASSPARRAGRAILHDFGALRDFGGTPVDLAAPDLGPYIVASRL